MCWDIQYRQKGSYQVNSRLLDTFWYSWCLPIMPPLTSCLLVGEMHEICLGRSLEGHPLKDAQIHQKKSLWSFPFQSSEPLMASPFIVPLSFPSNSLSSPSSLLFYSPGSDYSAYIHSSLLLMRCTLDTSLCPFLFQNELSCKFHSINRSPSSAQRPWWTSNASNNDKAKGMWTVKKGRLGMNSTYPSPLVSSSLFGPSPFFEPV